MLFSDSMSKDQSRGKARSSRPSASGGEVRGGRAASTVSESSGFPPLAMSDILIINILGRAMCDDFLSVLVYPSHRIFSTV
jgi:hypothetical protein